MNRAVGLLTLASFASMIAGFLREAAIAARFGASGDADALALAMFYVDGVAAVAVVGIAGTLLVPVIARAMQNHGVDETFRVLDSCLLWAALLMAPLVLWGVLAPEPLAAVAAPEFGSERRLALVELLRFASPTIGLVVISGVMAGILQAHRDYLSPVHGRTAFALVIAVVVFLFPAGGLRAVSAGLIAGGVALAMVQGHALLRLGWRPKRPRLWHPTLAHALQAAVPTLLAIVLINLLMGGLQRATASALPPGGLAAMNYALRALNIVSGLTVSLATVSLTELAHRYEAEGVGPGVLGVLREALDTGLWLLVPLTCLLALASEPLLGVLFLRGHFDVQALHETARCLRWLSGAVIPGMVIAILMRAAPAFGRPWKAVWISVVWTLGTVLSTAALVSVLGAASLAAGHTIGISVATVASALLLRDVVPLHFYRATVAYAVRLAAISAAGVGMTLVVLWIVGGPPSPGLVDSMFQLLLIGGSFLVGAAGVALATGEVRTRRLVRTLMARTTLRSTAE